MLQQQVFCAGQNQNLKPVKCNSVVCRTFWVIFYQTSLTSLRLSQTALKKLFLEFYCLWFTVSGVCDTMSVSFTLSSLRLATKVMWSLLSMQEKPSLKSWWSSIQSWSIPITYSGNKQFLSVVGCLKSYCWPYRGQTPASLIIIDQELFFDC